MLSLNDLKLISSLKQKKNREKEGKFLIEGFHLVEECLKSDYIIESIIISESLTKAQTGLSIEGLIEKKIPIHFIKKNQFTKLTETENSQGIIAVVNKRLSRILDNFSGKLFVALDRISDPGNLGTIIRTAYWFNVDGVLLSKDSVDLYNSKVIRATQGALFHINVFENMDLCDELMKFKKNDFEILSFDVNAKVIFDKLSFGQKNVFLFGNEADGISSELSVMPFENVKIQGFSDCESLNVSISCGIALYYFKSKTNMSG